MSCNNQNRRIRRSDGPCCKENDYTAYAGEVDFIFFFSVNASKYRLVTEKLKEN